MDFVEIEKLMELAREQGAALIEFKDGQVTKLVMHETAPGPKLSDEEAAELWKSASNLADDPAPSEDPYESLFAGEPPKFNKE